MSHGMSQENGTAERPHKAGAFDVRNVIAGLIGFYGVVLVLVAIFGEEQSDKTGGVNANLWAGLALLVVGLCFLAWARLRPVVVPADVHKDDEAAGERPGGH